jgi:hypothetical protein
MHPHTHTQVRGQQKEEDKLRDLESRRTALQHFQAHKRGAASRAVLKFQRRLRKGLAQRRIVRLVEFDSWLRDCRVKRFWLAVIANLFVATLGLFTMVVCVLLSAAFTAAQTVAWVESVMQSIAMQVSL